MGCVCWCAQQGCGCGCSHERPVVLAREEIVVAARDDDSQCQEGRTGGREEKGTGGREDGEETGGPRGNGRAESVVEQSQDVEREAQSREFVCCCAGGLRTVQFEGLRGAGGLWGSVRSELLRLQAAKPMSVPHKE
eukprot:723042-Rhodomonas_salina.2